MKIIEFPARVDVLIHSKQSISYPHRLPKPQGIFCLLPHLFLYFLSTVYCLLSTSSLATITFERTYGGLNRDEGYSIQQTMDGGYVIAGTTESFGAGLSDVFLIKTDSMGNILWTKTHGGDSLDEGRSVQQTVPDGGYIIAGYTGSFGAGFIDVYLIKTDRDGFVVGVEEDSDFRFQIEDLRLEKNRPNPFHHSTLIRYIIPAVSSQQSSDSRPLTAVRLSVYDITGRLVEMLVNEPQKPGIYQLPITSHQFPSSGIYFYRLSTRFGQTAVRKLILLK